jgi:hypothetical protein
MEKKLVSGRISRHLVGTLALALFVGGMVSILTWVVLCPLSSKGCETEPSSLSNIEFLRKILRAYSFRDSEGVLKRVVTYNTNSARMEVTIYLTNDIFDSSSAVKLGSFSTACCELEDLILSYTGKKILALAISEIDGNRYILASEDGTIISDNAVGDNAEAIGLGTVIRPQYAVSSAGFRADSEGTFEVTIGNSLGETYIVGVNGFTGEYIEGSRRRVD